jgi:hypothetical protein
MRNVAVEFITDDYVLSHGAPRGRGSWAFSLERDTPSTSDEMWFSPSATYTEAKKLAAAHFRARLARTSAAPLCRSTCITLWVQP